MNEQIRRIKEIFYGLPPLQRGIATGFGLGLTAFLVIFGLFFGPNEKDLIETLALSDSLSANQEIHENVLAIRKIPKRYLPSGFISPNNLNLIVNKPTRIPLERGSVLRWHDLKEDFSSWNQLSSQIPEGLRAISLSLHGAKGLDKFLKPGDFIDLLGTFQIAKREMTKILFQNIQVLKSSPSPVLLVTPKQAELLHFADHQGEISFTLRNNTDHKEISPLPEQEFYRFLGLGPRTSGESMDNSQGPLLLTLPRRKSS